MQIEHPVCCGIDVHKDMLTACLRRVDANGQVSKERREFATTYTSLLTLSDWLVEQHCPLVAMGSTGGLLEACLSFARLDGPGVHCQCARAAQPPRQKDGQKGCGLDRGALGPWAHPAQLCAPSRDWRLAGCDAHAGRLGADTEPK